MSDPFSLYIPHNLTFHDYISIIQVARTLVDGYDRKDPNRLLAILAPTLDINYTLVVPHWGRKTYTANEFTSLWLSSEHLGLKPLATQHLLGQPYFQSFSPAGSSSASGGDGKAVVEFQQIASHGRKDPAPGNSYGDPMCKIEETSNHRAFMRLTLEKTLVGGTDDGGNAGMNINTGGPGGPERGRWRITEIRPEVLFAPGDFMRVRRPHLDQDQQDNGKEKATQDK